MIDLDVVRPGSTVRIPFSTFAAAGQSLTMTNFAAADILVYRDGSTTERASTSGFTATTDFDGKTGRHVAIIDLSDNTTAGFYTAGSEYLVAIDSVTVDGLTVGTWIGRFRIGQRAALFDTTIATLSSQTSFTLTSGPADDNALTGMWALIHAAASAVQFSWVRISGYTGSTKTVTLAAGASFTAAAGDNISIMAITPALSADCLTAAGVRTAVGMASANLDTQLSAIAGYIDTEVGAIKAKTDLIPGSPASTTDCLTAAGVRSAVGLASANLDAQLLTISGYIDTEVGAIKAKTDLIPSSPAAVGDIPTAAQNAAGLLDLANGVETGLTVRESLRAAVSALVGILAGAATGTITIRNVGNTKTRITATVDADGNRSAVTLDVS